MNSMSVYDMQGKKREFYLDKLILRREFKPGEKMLLYNSKLHIFLGKIRSKWNNPYLIERFFPMA